MQDVGGVPPTPVEFAGHVTAVELTIDAPKVAVLLGTEQLEPVFHSYAKVAVPGTVLGVNVTRIPEKLPCAVQPEVPTLNGSCVATTDATAAAIDALPDVPSDDPYVVPLVGVIVPDAIATSDTHASTHAIRPRRK